jgi:sugar phosphate isomerase/epimerase
MIEHTDPRVEFIPDTYWIRFAGKDIEEYLEKLKGRVNTLHLKDYKNKIFRAVGKGTLDFKSILETAEKCGVQNAVVELDFSPNPYKSVEFSMNTLKRIANAN